MGEEGERNGEGERGGQKGEEKERGKKDGREERLVKCSYALLTYSTTPSKLFP